MAAHDKIARQLARQLLKLSLVDGSISAERVGGVLAWVDKHRPVKPLVVLKAYHRLVAMEIAKGRAVVEHAGSVSSPVLDGIATAMSKRYSRNISATATPNPSLIAGLRIRVGDDVYDASVAGTLAALAAGS